MASFPSYNITEGAGPGGYYFFTTRYGVEYEIGISDFSDWYGLPLQKFPGIRTMYLNLKLLNSVAPAPLDQGIRATMVAFILDIMDRQPDDALFYVISDANNKLHQRRLTFDRWFTSTIEKPGYIGKTCQLLEDQEIHFLYRKDRPNVAALINDIETYSLLPRHPLRS